MARDPGKTSASIWDTAGMAAMALAALFLAAQIVYSSFVYLAALSAALAMVFWLVDRWAGGGQRCG
ncbi:MAG: hypothetical protein RQ897_15780 [Thermoflexus sp.]|nr:hypothetical protein [Thermoflexus sp.]MDT7949798.1 hypothetical protein [Thermoflexus sp.]